jgi:hypothetical protein
MQLRYLVLRARQHFRVLPRTAPEPLHRHVPRLNMRARTRPSRTQPAPGAVPSKSSHEHVFDQRIPPPTVRANNNPEYGLDRLDDEDGHRRRQIWRRHTNGMRGAVRPASTRERVDQAIEVVDDDFGGDSCQNDLVN